MDEGQAVGVGPHRRDGVCARDGDPGEIELGLKEVRVRLGVEDLQPGLVVVPLELEVVVVVAEDEPRLLDARRDGGEDARELGVVVPVGLDEEGHDDEGDTHRLVLRDHLVQVVLEPVDADVRAAGLEAQVVEDRLALLGRAPP